MMIPGPFIDEDGWWSYAALNPCVIKCFRMPLAFVSRFRVFEQKYG